MKEVKNMKVEIVDEHHIFVNNKQFISLKRFGEEKEAIAKEIKLVVDKNEELAEENEALKILLKKQLNDIEDTPSIATLATEALVVKMCTSDEDHEWECCGISTEGETYRCKKCGLTKIYPYEFNGKISITI